MPEGMSPCLLLLSPDQHLKATAFSKGLIALFATQFSKCFRKAPSSSIFPLFRLKATGFAIPLRMVQTLIGFHF